MTDRPGEMFPESVRIKGEGKETSRRESAMRASILKILEDGPKSVPEIADALGIKPHEAMWWVMGCWRYGYIAPDERPSAEGYFSYRLVEREG